MKKKTITIVFPMRNPKRHLTKEQMVEIIRNWEAKNDNKTN